jgi:hypothetical protein
VFWQIDVNRRIRTGKLIAYDRATGNRRKDVSPNWVHALLKKAGKLPENFALKQCYFGEHLLSKYPGLPIAIVESEKSAVVASLCKSVFPDLIWLACGGKSNLKVERLLRLGNDRTILLFPDADGFEKWQITALEASISGADIRVSDLIEKRATEAQKRSGWDIADYLIQAQIDVNRSDPAIEMNSNLQKCSPDLDDIYEERKSIMMIDGGLTARAVDTYLLTHFAEQ